MFIDLESVKKDTEYELFFLRKEDGTRFFSPRLIRNVKLVSDFEGYLREGNTEDPLFNIIGMPDKEALFHAREIIHSTKEFINRFVQISVHTTDQELVRKLNCSLMGLMMASNSANLSHRMPVKNCRDYFYDFLIFFRKCVSSTEYQKIVTATPEEFNKLESCTIKLIHSLSTAIYTQLSGSNELGELVHGLIQQANDQVAKDHKHATTSSKTIYGQLAGEYAALTKLMKQHPNGPLNKVLTALEDGKHRGFDTLLQDNLPSVMYALYIQDSKCLIARWPCPTHQELINKACVNEEFKAFLRSCGHENVMDRCLLFNFQDRLTWKEHFRCTALEDLSNHPSFKNHLATVTLAKDTEFYHQDSPYSQENRADVFIKNFKEQLTDQNCGFVIPPKIFKELSDSFINPAMEAIHRIFFSGKNVLLKENRMEFIEIFYIFLQLKIIDCVRPNIVGFSCKDGLDISLSAGAELFIFLKLCSQEQLSEHDREHLDVMLYGPCLVGRERIIMPDRFDRMLKTIKVIEIVRAQYGREGFCKIIQEAFGLLYKSPVLSGKIAGYKT